MKQKNLPLIFCSILCGLFILILLPNSLMKDKPAAQPTYSTSSAKSAPLKSNEPDQLNAPDAIIFHMETIDFTLPKGNEFDEIVRLINRSLKGTKISSSSAWADFEVPKYMSGITTIEFDYSKLQTSSFEYVGIRTTPSNGKPYELSEQLKYTKLVFPLTDSKDEGRTVNRSVSAYSVMVIQASAWA